MVQADTPLSEDQAYIRGLAYRMLGSVSDAEEVAQEAVVRWLSAGRPEVRSMRAWLTKAATRICLDRLKSAARRREHYVGDNLPEPLVTSDAAERAEVDETLSMALLVTLQRMRASERAVFLLHDIFGYRFHEVGDIIGLGPEHCRQLAVRARRSLRTEGVRDGATPEQIGRLSAAFFDAVRLGDERGLCEVLSEDVVFRSDGGGKVAASPRPIRGRDRVVGFLLQVVRGPDGTQASRREILWLNGA
ncbi:MAG: sigma-70 family RNA polymerase sigma factor, partial [Phycisphaeraceae bacterium]|nr:sigma-70 family RNA polymerase sigma factor [Phycisphaeraceae bacterium]